MRKANLVAGAGVVFLLLLVALTFDPLGFFEDTRVDPQREDLGGDPLTSSGLKGRGTRALPDADPKTWEGEPVGVLVLTLGKATLKGLVTGRGEPLRFARVRPVLPPPHHTVAVRTRKDGTWEVRGLPDGQHEIRAAAPEYLGRTTVAPPVAGEETATVETIDLRPRPENKDAVIVKVTDVFGRPIPGAKVLATTAPWDLQLAMGVDMAGIPGVLHKSGITDQNGRVKLAPLFPEEYSLVATAPGYVNASIDKLVVATGRTRNVGLKLVEGVAVRGRVTDGEGGPIEGAVVMGFAQPSFHSSLTARTGADGRFVLDGLRKSQYMFVAWEEKYGATMAPGQAPGTLDIKLPGTGHVKGKAVWEDGSPVTSGHVRPFQVGPFQYVYSQVFPIGSDGTFEFNMPKGTYNCRVQTADGFVSDGTTVDVEVGATQTVEVRVPKSAVVRGVVMDEQGNHIEGAEVFVMQGGFPETPSREQYARTDADGRFEVPGLEAGVTVSLHVQHGDHADTQIRDVLPDPIDKARERSVRLKAGASVSGRVTDPGGAGIAGEQVNLATGWLDARSTFTDNSGAYRFDAVAPGTYMMTTGPFEQGARGLSRSDIKVGEEGVVTINFETPAAAGKVSGLVTQAGAPVPGAEVTLTDARGAEKTVAVRTGDDGRFAAEGLQYGSVRVVAKTAAGMVGTARIRVDEGASAEVTVDIGTSTVRARVLDTEGEPASGCWINVELADSEGAGWSRVKDNGNSGTDGVFLSKGLQPGRYVLRVNRVEFAQYVSAPFTLAEGENKDLGDIRMTAGVLLKGVVRDDAGAPVEKATVSLRDMQGNRVQLFSMATSGSDGRYAMHSVEPGRYTVHFQARGHAPDEKILEITGQGSSADAILTRGATVRVIVKDQGGTPIGDARIRLVDGKGREVTRTISLVNFDTGRRYTGGDGVTSLSDLAAGTYVVRCEKAGFVTVGADARATLEPGMVTTVNITVEAAP